jgi:hypothetical protein
MNVKELLELERPLWTNDPDVYQIYWETPEHIVVAEIVWWERR